MVFFVLVLASVLSIFSGKGIGIGPNIDIGTFLTLSVEFILQKTHLHQICNNIKSSK